MWSRWRELSYLICYYLKFRFFGLYRSRKDLETYQQKLLKKILKHAVKRTSFYRTARQSDIKLKNFPIIDKSQMMRHFNTLNTLNMDIQEVYQRTLLAEQTRDFDLRIGSTVIGLSSGTTGARGVFLVTLQERLKHAAYIFARYISPFGGDVRVAYFQRADSPLYQTGKSKRIRLVFFDLINPLEQSVEKLNSLQPTILCAPSRILKKLALLQKNKILNIQPQRVINIMEVLDPIDQDLISANFAVKHIDQFYMATEGVLGITCEEGQLHLCEDLIYFEKEYLAGSQSLFYPIITDLHRKGQPHIRYKMTDILEESTASCACGSAAQVIKAVHGRKDDILTFRTALGGGIEVYPDILARQILLSHPDIYDYQICMTDDQRLRIFVQPIRKDIHKTVHKKISAFLEERKATLVDIEFSEYPIVEKGKKFRRIFYQAEQGMLN